MASFSQPSFFSSLVPIKKNNFPHSPQPKNFPALKISKISSSKSEPSPNLQEKTPEDDKLDSIKLAFAKAKSYRSSIKSGNQTPNIVQSSPQEPSAKVVAENEGAVASKIAQNSTVEKVDKDDDGGKKEVPLSFKLALEKEMEYNKDNGVVDQTLDSGLKGGKKTKLTVSSMDFVGLGFADKKSGRSLPAGLVQQSDHFPGGELPEVEFLVGDTSNFGDTVMAPSVEEEIDDDLYKPKVSTWGVFPRPNNISKAYGGGRTLRPGEKLETAEEKAAKEARTRKLVAAYKTKYGLNIDPKLKSECEKELKDGDSLMEVGRLKEAIPFYERVMEKLPFESELHGFAALQWSICLDSLCRSDEARAMYEKLQSHPKPQVSKKARQFYFSFQAMEMMKVTSSSRSPRSTGYQNYFDAFVQDKTTYTLEEEDEIEGGGGLNQTLPYIVFMVSPILLVFLISAFRPH